MDNFTNNILVANALIDADRNCLLSRRNRLLQELGNQLHLDLSTANNSLQTIGDNLRKKRYVIVDFFYDIYDEIIQIDYDEARECFMLFGTHHSWQIYIHDMDKYTFGRIKTKLSYSELYDTVVTLEDLVNEFDIGYSMDSFDSVISKSSADKLNSLAKISDDLKEEETFELKKAQKALADAEMQLDKYETMRNEARALPKPISKGDVIASAVGGVVSCALTIAFIILGICVAALCLIGALFFGAFFLSSLLYGFSRCVDARTLESLDYDPAQKLKLALAGIEEMEKKINTLKSETLAHIKDEYDAKITSADKEVKDFVDSYRK